MNLSRYRSQSIGLAMWFSCIVFVFAAANWTLNVCHFHWQVRCGSMQIDTWLGALEIWSEPASGWSGQPMHAFCGRGGVVGPNGLATVLAHIRWLPRIEYYNDQGPISLSPVARVATRTLYVIPMWSVALLSAAPLVVLLVRARRRRAAGLCVYCDYSLVGLPREPDGRTICPECGRRARLAEEPSRSESRKVGAE